MAERGVPIMSYAAYMNAPTAGFDTMDDISYYKSYSLQCIRATLYNRRWQSVRPPL